MDKEEFKTNSSLLGGLGLAVVGTTCCALPIMLVTLGLGGVVASTVSALPILVAVSKYKAVTFALTATVLAYSGWRLHRVSQCDPGSYRRSRWQRRILLAAAVILAFSVFTAYALLPITLWLESH